MSRNNLDLVKFKVQSIRYGKLQAQYLRDYGVSDEKLRLMIANLGVVVSSPDLEIFFVVTKPTYEEAKKATNRGKRHTNNEPSGAMLFGSSPAIALTKESCKTRFQLAIQGHNSST